MTSRLSQLLKDAFALRQSYRTVFDKSDSGQRVLRHLMKIGFITRSPIVAGDHDQTMANIGMQRIVQSILRYICANDDDLRKQIELAYQAENESPQP